jgi:hypothetical protein
MKRIIFIILLFTSAVSSQSVNQSDNVFNSPRLLFGYGGISFFTLYDNCVKARIYHVGSVKFIRPLGKKIILNAAVDFAADGFKNFTMFHIGAGYKMFESDKFCGYSSLGVSGIGDKDGGGFVGHIILTVEHKLSQNHTIGLDLRNFIGENYAFSPVIYISLNVGRKSK